MINQKKTVEAVATFLVLHYIQHNSLIPDAAVGLAWFFRKMAKDRANLRVVVHRIIAAGDYVWAHVNFINLFNDNPKDRGIASVDIYKMDPDGKAVEHWDVLPEISDPTNACP
jgi:predicted SnoaL-like aldol condensation-catalyzing enzyme